MKISEIVDIYPGQPIRDRIENSRDGEYLIVQMKDVDRDAGISVESLYRTHLKGRIGPRLVKRGDLLFVSRVFRESLPYSAYVNADIPDLVAAPTFQILTVNEHRVRAEFLHWYINSEVHGGRYFKKNAMGGSVLNIPKAVLSEMEVVLPPLADQDRFIQLIHAANREKEIMKSLVAKRSALLDEALGKFTAN